MENGTETQAVTVRQSTEIAAPVTEQTLRDYLFGQGTQLTEPQQNVFFNIALRNQLDPFKREIYAVKYGNNFSVVTGYQVYLARASATGQLDGWKTDLVRDAAGNAIAAQITIHRKDFGHPVEWTVLRSEFDQKQANWKNMPEFMLQKVAIAQGFRLAFPEAIGGLPYTEQEMQSVSSQQTAPRQAPRQPQRKSRPVATPPVQAPPATDADPNLITEDQIKMLWARINEAQISQDEFREFLRDACGVESSREIRRSELDTILAWVEGGAPKI